MYTWNSVARVLDMVKQNRPIMIDAKRKHWAVSLIEVVGSGMATVNIECIVHDIPADNGPDACRKALMQYLRKHGIQSEPKLQWYELEPYSKPIEV